MRYYFLIVSLFSIVSAQQHRIIIDQDCYPDVINLHKQSQSSLDAEAKVTTQEMQKRAQEDELEWSILFTEFFPVQKQDLSPTPIFNANSRADIEKRIAAAQQEAYEAEKKYERLQQLAVEAKLIAAQKSAEVDALQKAKL